MKHFIEWLRDNGHDSWDQLTDLSDSDDLQSIFSANELDLLYQKYSDEQ